MIEESKRRETLATFELDRTFTLGLDVIAQWSVEDGEVIVDNDLSAGYIETGTWGNSGAIDTYNGGSAKSRFTNNVGDTATYTPTSLESGLYEVWVWISANSDTQTYDRDTQAKYTITHDGGEIDEVTFNQETAPGEWVKLTDEHFYFAGDGTETVKVERTSAALAGHATVADAVKFVRVEATRYFVNDAHGSTRGLADKNGHVVRTFDYDAYGNAINFDASAALTSLLYSGEEFNINTGLSYLRARYYDPSNGRFTRVDPWAGDINDPLTLHKYGYVHGNPIINVDPSGLFSIPSMAMTISLLAGLNGLVTGSINAIEKRSVTSFFTGYTSAYVGTAIQLAMLTIPTVPTALASGFVGGFISSFMREALDSWVMDEEINRREVWQSVIVSTMTSGVLGAFGAAFSGSREGLFALSSKVDDLQSALAKNTLFSGRKLQDVFTNLVSNPVDEMGDFLTFLRLVVRDTYEIMGDDIAGVISARGATSAKTYLASSAGAFLDYMIFDGIPGFVEGVENAFYSVYPRP